MEIISICKTRESCRQGGLAQWWKCGICKFERLELQCRHTFIRCPAAYEWKDSASGAVHNASSPRRVMHWPKRPILAGEL